MQVQKKSENKTIWKTSGTESAYVQLTIESKGGGHGGHSLGEDSVDVGVGRTLDFAVTLGTVSRLHQLKIVKIILTFNSTISTKYEYFCIKSTKLRSKPSSDAKFREI